MNTERDISFTRKRSKREAVPSSTMLLIGLLGVLLITEGTIPFNENNALIRSKILTDYGSTEVKKYHYDGCRTLSSCVYGIIEGSMGCTSVSIANGPPCSNSSLLLEQVQLPTIVTLRRWQQLNLGEKKKYAFPVTFSQANAKSNYQLRHVCPPVRPSVRPHTTDSRVNWYWGVLLKFTGLLWEPVIFISTLTLLN